MTSRPLSSRPLVWSVRSTLRHVSTRKNSLLQRLKQRTSQPHPTPSPLPSSTTDAPPSTSPPPPLPSPPPSDSKTSRSAKDTPSPINCASLPLLLASPQRSRHHPYQRISTRSTAPRSPESDGCGRPTARSTTSAPTLTTSRSSEWLAAYNEAWEDGTGLDIDPLSDQHVDYFYVPDGDVRLTRKGTPAISGHRFTGCASSAMSRRRVSRGVVR